MKIDKETIRIAEPIVEAKVLTEKYASYESHGLLVTFEDGTELLMITGALRGLLSAEDKLKLSQEFAKTY